MHKYGYTFPDEELETHQKDIRGAEELKQRNSQGSEKTKTPGNQEQTKNGDKEPDGH